MILDPQTKYDIADRLVVESRSKTDIVQDVWDELAALFTGLSQTVERTKLHGDKHTIMKAIMKGCRSPLTEPEECDPLTQAFLSDVADAVLEVLK